MRIEKSKLLDVLGPCAQIVPPEPVADVFAFAQLHLGPARFSCETRSDWARMTIEVDVEPCEQQLAFVRIWPFIETVRRMPEGTLDIQSTATHITITSGRSKTKISTRESVFGLKNQSNGATVHAPNLAKILASVAHAATLETSRPMLLQISVEPENVRATNGHVFAYRTIKTGFAMNFPIHVVQLFPQGDAQISTVAPHRYVATFAQDDITRDVEFSSCEQPVPATENLKTMMDRSENSTLIDVAALREALETCLIKAEKGGFEPIRMRFDGGLHLSSSQASSGKESEAFVECTTQKTSSLSISAELLRKSLAKFDGKVWLKYGSKSTDALVVESDNGFDLIMTRA